MQNKINPAVEIPIDDDLIRTSKVPSQLIPESEKTANWYFKNLDYIISFYNQPNGVLNFNSVNSQSSSYNGYSDYTDRNRIYPVQFMIRMMQYYLGKQPNLNYNWLVQDVQQSNLQATWIRGNDVSEFINYFRGLIVAKISKPYFTAKPLSKDSFSKKTDLYNQLMLKFDMKDYFDQMKSLGVEFNPANTPDFELPEEIEKWVDTNFKEYGSIIATDLANGIWFTNNWFHKVLQSFMHVTITGMCAMEHYVQNGRVLQKVKMPYQIIWDNRVDDDYGRYDQFIGCVENMTTGDIFSKYPELTEEQRIDIENIASKSEYGQPYNNSNNINWWVYDQQNKRNTVTVVTVYWRGRRSLNKKKAYNKYDTPRILRAKEKDADPNYAFDDIYKATLIGNKYLVNWGLQDNIVEEFGDKSKPLFPILRFMPNTFMGESISEVARVHKIQDELDMYDFKIREMIGRSKGKVYYIDGRKFDETTTPKEFFENISSIGFHIGVPSGEDRDQSNSSSAVEQIDMTLDPGVSAIAALYREKRERMNKILSVSQVSLGQQTKYIGLGTQQGTINQNNIGTSYLVDSFMEWVTMNMRYAVNQAKNLYTIGDNKEAEFLVGDRGVAYLKFTKDIRFEDFFIELNINDSIDEATKQRTLAYAQAWSQNPEWGVSALDILKLDRSNSSTKSIEELEYSIKKSEKNKAKIQEQQLQQQAELQQQSFEQQAIIKQADLDMKAALEQLKQDNENYRMQYTQDMKALLEQVKVLSSQLPEAPPKSQLQNTGQNQMPS